jgi:S1-C subfamily serine protease
LKQLTVEEVAMRSMGLLLKLLFVLSLMVIADVQPTRGQDAVVDLRRTHERAVFAMVRIEVRTRRGDIVGTGWLLQQSAGVRPVVVTNKHMVDAIAPRTAPRISFYQGSQQPSVEVAGRVAYISRTIDFAVIALEADPPAAPREPRALTIEANDVVRGERVVLAGNPQGWPFQTTEGVVSGVAPANPECGVARNCIMIDAASMGGSSGGPALNRDGNVVGMLWGGPSLLAAFHISVDNPAFAFLIHARVLREELNNIAARARQ